MRTTRRKEFEQTALPHLADLYAVAARLTRDRDQAQDLVQDTYLRAYAAWDAFIPETSCRAWLIRILTNAFISGYRRRRSQRLFSERAADEQLDALYGPTRRAEHDDPEGTLLGDRLGDEVTAALDALSPEYRAVVVLADLEGMRYRDVATILGCPLGTVMSRLFRARRQLEERLAPYASADYGIRRAA